MAKRNPMNERYQKHTSPAGKTRKSAAAAKPKRNKPGETSKPAKGSSKSLSRVEQRDKRREAYNKRMAMMHPATPEYRRMRRIWWLFLGGAIVLSTVAWLLWSNVENRAFGNYVLVAAYISMGIAVWIDWTKLRKLRQEWAQAGGGKTAKGSAPESKSKQPDTSGSDES